MATAIFNLPSRLWFTLKSYLDSPKDKHNQLWNSIFQKDDWLSSMIVLGVDPALVGYDLYKTKPTYLALVLGHEKDGGKYHKPDPSRFEDLLYKCLQPGAMRTAAGEYYFPKTGLILNIRDARGSEFHYTDVPEPGRLVSHNLVGRHSAYQYWKDESFAVRQIQSKNIVGIKRALATDDVSDILGLTWEHLPSETLRQHFFQKAGTEVWTHQIDNGERGLSYKVIGWKWKN